MRIERVVVDASPLIVLFKSGLAELLPQLFSEVIVPASVRREVMSRARKTMQARALPRRPGPSLWKTRSFLPSSPAGTWAPTNQMCLRLR